MTLTELRAAKQVMEAARFSGIRTLEYGDGRRVTYVSESEFSSALADLNRQITEAEMTETGRTRRSRYRLAYSSKGL